VLIAGLAVHLQGADAGVALRVGLYLAQAGEFGFVLLTLGGQHANLVAPELDQPDPGSMVLSMLATPFLILYTNRIVSQAVGQRLAAAVGAADDDRKAGRSAPRST
jgi:CPA2 family monovalent cation:H+ antiporter-2